MENSNQFKTAMITGATGYVAGWIVKRLLNEGYTVHAPVRDPENSEKLKYLNTLAENAPGGIRYFKADLLAEGSYDEAMQGCEVVFHTASPFVMAVNDPQKELIEPAQLGTRNVLESANRTPTVKRVVLTSSCAAIYGDNADLALTANRVFTEEDWNQTSSLEHQPYSYSKTVAEKEAWKIAKAQDRWDLVVINPSLVIGPGINPRGTSESFNLIRQFGDGTMKAGCPTGGWASWMSAIWPRPTFRLPSLRRPRAVTSPPVTTPVFPSSPKPCGPTTVMPIRFRKKPCPSGWSGWWDRLWTRV